MRAVALLVIAVMGMAASSEAKEKAPPPSAPNTEPDWTAVRKQAEALLRHDLLDPSSAQIQWQGGWRWGHTKTIQLGSKRTWGWLGCASMNAKNRMGGYVGADAYFVLITPEGKAMYGRQMEVTSECDGPNRTPLQAAFMNVPPGEGGSVSIADELAKLADLKARGILTQAEFDAQKAKLLNK